MPRPRSTSRWWWWTRPRDERFGVVVTDHAGGARIATEHLLSLGHSNVHHVRGPVGSFAAGERERGWREALAAAGLEAPGILQGDWSAAAGHVAGVALAADRGATAVFCANDQMALGVLRAFADAGRPAPDGVSIVGFDDVADAADYRPPLTTVRQDFDRLGAQAVAQLVEQMDAGEQRFETVPTALVVRESTAPAVR